MSIYKDSLVSYFPFSIIISIIFSIHQVQLFQSIFINLSSQNLKKYYLPITMSAEKFKLVVNIAEALLPIYNNKEDAYKLCISKKVGNDYNVVFQIKSECKCHSILI